MEQNNFEKQVQQKMEELKIHPSESAWGNIEKRIAQNSNRKKLIFILSILIPLVLFTAFYWAYNSSKSNSSGQKNESFAIVKNGNQKNDLSVEKPDQLNKNYTETEKRTERKKDEVKIKKFNSKNQPLKKINSPRILKSDLSDFDSSQEKVNKIEIVNDNKVEKSLSPRTVYESQIKADAADKMNGNNITNESSSTEKEDENVKEKLAFKKQTKEDTAAVVGPSKISTVKKQKANWDMGFAVTGGTSFAGNVPLSINKSADYLASPATGGSSQPPNYYMPSKSGNSLAFTAGVFIQKNIFAKNKISIGLNYKYFSTTNKVGNKIDSLRSNFYSATSPANQSHDFHNKFHFLELPVTFKLRLNPNKSLPLYWNAGFSISQLIATNALQFKNDRGLYYQDNSFFNKTQIGFNTGFSATLFSKNKNAVSVGPYFYYGATSLSNKGLYNQTHFSFIGISAEILLNKK